MSFPTNWTAPEDLTLRGFWADGLPIAEIGRQMDRTKNSIVGRAHRLGLSGRDSPIIRDGRPATKRAVPKPPRITLPAMASAAPLRMAVAIKYQAPTPPPKPAVVVAYVSRGSCQWPGWSDTEQPKYGADGLPLMCGATRARGSYCLEHANAAYTKRVCQAVAA